MNTTGESAGDSENDLIDARSPGERWADSGRASLDRLQMRVAEQRFDLVALAWIVLVLTISVAQIYLALRFGNLQGFPGGEEWWYRLQLIAASGDIVLILGCAVGIALAVLFEGAYSRTALRLAAIGGAWAGVAGLLGIAVTFHEWNTGDSDMFFRDSAAFDGNVARAAIFLAYSGLGILVATVAWRFAKSDAGAPSTDAG